ncbi:MAG: VWA domain-containing protein [Spirochaetota bacterium]|nr:MAG: VWA domain-containing protein [Spirochaetota bacterium]
MKSIILLSTLISLLIASSLVFATTEAYGQVETERPEVEVVFCLDTTGSMSGLIEGAKQKIWGIANQIIKGNPQPRLTIGLVGYRDYGDEYVTKIYPLNDDLDTVFENLMSFMADGGGDTPEHVNKALHDSVHRINWSADENTLKLIFLVGDCPPHMDYKDGFDYRDICQDAVKDYIIVNTVQCGDSYDTVSYWKDIARLGEGKYARIPQSGGMQVIETPYDAELFELNSALEETVVAFGSRSVMAKSEIRKEKLKEMAPEAAAERAAYKSADRRLSSYDLIDAIEDDEVSLESLRDSELPDEMKKMSLKDKRKYLEQKKSERETIMQKIDELSGKRSVYIEQKLKEAPGQDSFDETVARIIEKQASKKGISY